MIKLFGITGFLASGKTTVSSFIKKQGVPVISLDDICEDLLKPGTNAYKELILSLGEDIIEIDGRLDVRELSLLSYKKEWIKNLVDDLIKSECINFINVLLETLDKYKIDVLGIENGFVGNLIDCDSIIFVDCPKYLRIERMKEKYKFNNQIIENILKLEEDTSSYNRYYIYNDLDLVSLEEKSINFLKQYLVNNIQ